MTGKYPPCVSSRAPPQVVTLRQMETDGAGLESVCAAVSCSKNSQQFQSILFFSNIDILYLDILENKKVLGGEKSAIS